MSRHEEYDEHDVHADHEPVRHPPGIGLAARFVIGLGVLVALIAAVASVALWTGARDVARETGLEAQRAMARRTGELLRDGVREGPISGQVLPAPDGVSIQTARATLQTERGSSQEARVFQVTADAPEMGGPKSRLLYAPSEAAEAAGDRLLVLIALVSGGVLLGTLLVGAFTARRVAAPLRSMVDDVLAISRGRLDRRIRAEGAPKEVTFLARAVDRMVQGLMAGQRDREALHERQREAEALRELRRNLRPLATEPPYGWLVETRSLEAEGAGTGDFVDSLDDADGKVTLVVGSTAARGMAGALLMAMTRAYLRGAVLQGASPATACDRTNSSLNRDLARGLYASAMVLRVDPESAAAELVSAGHKAPAVRWDAEAGQLRKLQPNGIALGFDDGPIFRKSLETVELQLHPGDALLLFSPTIFQCASPSGKELGEAGVYSLAKIAIQEGLEAMTAKLESFLGGAPPADLVFALLRNNRFD